MEHAQRDTVLKDSIELRNACLNPYFNGTCSKRHETDRSVAHRYVLILILMEHAQRVKNKQYDNTTPVS